MGHQVVPGLLGDGRRGSVQVDEKMIVGTFARRVPLEKDTRPASHDVSWPLSRSFVFCCCAHGLATPSCSFLIGHATPCRGCALKRTSRFVCLRLVQPVAGVVSPRRQKKTVEFPSQLALGASARLGCSRGTTGPAVGLIDPVQTSTAR